MKFDGDEEYKDPDEAEFAPLEDDEDEFVDEDLSLADDIIGDDDDTDDEDEDESEILPGLDI